MAQASHNFSATFLQKNYIFFTNLSKQKIPQFLATADRNNRELTYPPSRTSNLRNPEEIFICTPYSADMGTRWTTRPYRFEKKIPNL